MKAKPIKKDGHYFLWSHDWNPKTKEGIIANTYDKPSGEVLQLSLKNCQAIERGYDLDELISAELEKLPYTKHLDDGQYNDGQLVGFELGAYWGFQKALEILGDRKFTEEDLLEAYSRGQTNSPVQSLQQNEWEVEVEMEEVDVQFDRAATSLSDYDHFTVTRKPKLDADGRLILKRATD